MEVLKPIKTFFKPISEPLNAIYARPYHFSVWWIVANVFGLAGFWLPLLILFMSGRSPYSSFQNFIQAGILASFSVVILTNGIAAAFTEVEAGSNPTAAGIRALICMVAFCLTIIQVGVLVAGHTLSSNIPDVSVPFQIFLTALAILIASYLYCFRFPSSWEPSVADVAEEEGRHVSDLGKTATSQDKDSKGVKL